MAPPTLNTRKPKPQTQARHSLPGLRNCLSSTTKYIQALQPERCDFPTLRPNSMPPPSISIAAGQPEMPAADRLALE